MIHPEDRKRQLLRKEEENRRADMQAIGEYLDLWRKVGPSIAIAPPVLRPSLKKDIAEHDRRYRPHLA